MIRKKIIVLSLSTMFVFGIYGVALGGFEPGGCSNLPEPNAGPFLYGEFTLAVDKSSCAQTVECAHYNLQLKVWKVQKGGNLVEEHLFSVPTPTVGGSICDLNAPEIVEYYGFYPCLMEVEQPYGPNYQGIPVISELQITKKDFCEDLQKQMISGWVKIRVVPE